MANFFVFLTAVTISLTASAQLVLPKGEYNSIDGCTLSITRAANGNTHVSVRKGNGFASGEFRVPIVSKSSDIFSILSCRGTLGSNVRLSRRDAGTSIIYRTQCGGAFDIVDLSINWEISKYDNTLLSLYSENLFAMFATTGGFHSGPVKTNEYPISCQKFWKVK